jgi:hypothetical protein
MSEKIHDTLFGDIHMTEEEKAAFDWESIQDEEGFQRGIQFVMNEAAKKLSELGNMDKEKAKESIIERLLKNDLDVDTVSQYTGSDKEKIREIQQNIE